MPDYWYVWIVAALLIVITAGFVMRFVRPAMRLRQEFATVIAALRQVRAAAPGTTPNREHITAKVMARTSFAHLWAEYAQTLHPQKPAGQDQARWRATALAETFFTDLALVDTPLKTEYYKHLPGIMTGLGIIGTFTGLIVGLGNFDVSIEPGQAQAQLRALINAVGHAFIVSAVAITLAMIFTWVEKSLVAACYRLTEHMRQEIDSLFDTGADVEYLERLVAAAESSADEIGQFRDTLAGQIAQALAEQTQLQIAAGDRNSERIAADLARLLSGTLARPIADIAAAVDIVGARQDETLTRMIADATSGFSRQMENLFAGQMRELHEVLSGTNGAMREMVAQFARLQADAGAAQGRLLTTLGNEVATVVAGLHRQSQAAADSQHAQVERLAEATTVSVGGMAGQIERLVAMSIATNQRLQETMDALARTSGDAVRGMNDGAARLGTAAGSFADAGREVAATLGEAAQAAADIRLAAASMKDTAEVARRMLGDYGDAHAAFARLTQDLKATVDRAKREASLSAELTDRLEAAAARLGAAQQQADTYLDGVSQVLAHAHQAFADSVERTLRDANRQFQSELSQAVGLLSGAIVDLGNTVETLAEQDYSGGGKTGSA